MTVSDLSVTISYAAWGTLPDEFSAIPTDFQTVTVVSSVIFITHETEKRHVDGSHAELECFKVETEILPIAVEDLCLVRLKINSRNEVTFDLSK